MTAKREWQGIKWVIWSVAALYYFVEYILRISPSLFINDIMQGFKLSAMQAGNLSATYFYVYAVMQVPVGMIIDRYGVKKPLLFAAFGCALGCIVFAYSTYVAEAMLGRALIGLGSSFGYLSCLKIVTNWFAVKHFGFMCGLVNMAGMLGAYFGEQLLSIFLTFLNWRLLMLYLSVMCIICAILIALIVKNAPRAKPHAAKSHKNRKTSIINALKEVMYTPQVWFCAVYVGVVYCTFDMIGALWGVAYLRYIYHLSTVEAAAINSLIFLGAIGGYLLFGYITTYFKRKHKKIMVVTIILMLLDSLLILYNPSNLLILKGLFLMMGFFCGVTSTATTLAKENMPLSISGLTMSLVNVFLVTSGSLTEPLFGFILDFDVHSKEHALVNISRVDFNHAFMILPCLYLVGLIMCFFIKQTRGQKRG